jgi:hypothetical protein
LSIAACSKYTLGHGNKEKVSTGPKEEEQKLEFNHMKVLQKRIIWGYFEAKHLEACRNKKPRRYIEQQGASLGLPKADATLQD